MEEGEEEEEMSSMRRIPQEKRGKESRGSERKGGDGRRGERFESGINNIFNPESGIHSFLTEIWLRMLLPNVHALPIDPSANCILSYG